MKCIIRFSAREELKALPSCYGIHWGLGLPDRTYVVSREAVQALRAAGIIFTELVANKTPHHLREPSSVKEFDIFLPLWHNDGTAVDAGKFRNLQRQLLHAFGGFMSFRSRMKAYWQMGTVVYRDEIVIFRVISDTREKPDDS